MDDHLVPEEPEVTVPRVAPGPEFFRTTVPEKETVDPEIGKYQDQVDAERFVASVSAKLLKECRSEDPLRLQQRMQRQAEEESGEESEVFPEEESEIEEFKVENSRPSL